MPNAPKGERLPLRISERDKALIARAAEVQRTTISEFVLGHALQAAESTLATQTRFELGEEIWAEFQAKLDAPPEPIPAFRTLLNEPGVFD